MTALSQRIAELSAHYRELWKQQVEYFSIPVRAADGALRVSGTVLRAVTAFLASSDCVCRGAMPIVAVRRQWDRIGSTMEKFCLFVPTRI